MDRSKTKRKSKKKPSGSRVIAPAAPAQQPSKSSTRQSSFPIVGVGASAGGLEAFIELLKAVPPQLGMAFVLVPHLDPSHESGMTEILSRVTNLPVLQVSDGMQARANHVYIIPPNAEMTISGGVLQLATRRLSRPQMLIDVFFRSLAVDQGTNAIGVILSGTATDGTLGLTAIKGEGGITFAQDSASAKYDGMPTSAIAAGCVDLVLPPAQIPRELARIYHHLSIADQQVEQSYSSHPEADHLGQIFRLLRQVKRVDFSEYKPATIRRRIMRRLALRRIEELSDYVGYLKNHREEIDALYQDILINVTSFFRNPGAFEALKQAAYPAILKDRSSGHSIRVWVPGCSTGEETYSHAIALVEYLSEIRSDIPVQIFGTDLSETAIQSARLGIYKENIQADVSPIRLRRFFTRTPEGYQISKSIRDLCVFAVQNVFNDPPFSHMEIVSCRNVLIYLSPSLQRRVVPIFHYALNPTGFLMVGNEEGLLGMATELFDLADRKHKIYRKKPAATAPVSFGFSLEHYAASTKRGQTLSGPAKEVEAARGPLDVQREADRMLLAKYVPAAVVVNEHLEILQSRGHTGFYLELAPGKASLNLLKMARPGLLFELQKAIDAARKTHTSARKENVQVQSNGGEKAVNLEVIPFRIPSGNDHENFLIVFEEAPQVLPPVEAKLATTQQRIKDNQAAQIKQELAATKEYLQSIIEAQEATNEELQSANEEIQSGNEELQSTNEELQTSKEELESANEELNTVNEEMQHRNQQLSLANNDLTNLLNSVNIPTVMLGPDLSVRRFTPQAEKVLGFSAGDVGRPITNLKLKINAPDMEKIMLNVIRDVVTEQRELQNDNGTWYRLRISPYRTSDNKIEGVVMTLLDITDLKQPSSLPGKEPGQPRGSRK